MKKNYVAPEIRVKEISTESLMASISGETSGGAKIHDDGEEGDADEGRAKGFNSWSEE